MRQRFDPPFLARRDRKSPAQWRLSGLRGAYPRALERCRASCRHGATPSAVEIRFPESLDFGSGREEAMEPHDSRVTIPALQQMKRDARKIVGVVVWDYQMAQIVDRVGVDIVSVGDSVGMNLWGRSDPLEVTLDEMLVVCKAVRRGVKRALVSCDFPFGPLQESTESALKAAVLLTEKGGADMVKLDGAAGFPSAVRAIARAGIPVFAQFGITPQTAQQYGLRPGDAFKPGAQVPAEMKSRLVDEARRLEEAGASLLDFTNSGPVAGEAVAAAVSIPVLGGLGGGPWLDGRMRMAHAAIGYAASNLDSHTGNYANVAKIAFEAMSAYVEDVRAGRQIKGAASGIAKNDVS